MFELNLHSTFKFLCVIFAANFYPFKPPWYGGGLGDHVGGDSSFGMMPTHSHTQRWSRAESM